jgi:hypothetical protein
MAVPILSQQSLPFEFSLRIRHPANDPAEISKALGLTPEHAFRAGQPRSTPSNVTARSVHSESYWLATLDPMSWQAAQNLPEGSPLSRMEAAFAQERSRELGSLGLAFNLFLMGFARRHEQFLRNLQSEGGQVSLLIEVTGAVHGFTITPEMSHMLDKTGIAVEFEFAED